MDPIANTDRLMALLRQRLRERAASAAAGKTGAAGRSPASAPQGLAALSTLQGLDQPQLRRTCIQALLAEQLGAGLVNDPRLQQVVTRVAEAIGSDARALGLLDQVVGELRAS